MLKKIFLQANKIDELCDRKKLKRAHLAKKSGLTPGAVSKAMNGGSVRRETVDAIAKALGVLGADISFTAPAQARQTAPPLLPSSQQSEGTAIPGSNEAGGENPDKDMLVKKIASQIAILADIEDVDDMRALSKMLDGLVPWDGDVDWDVMRKFGIEEVIRRRVEAIRETPKT